MKKIILILLMLVSIQAFSQKKSKDELILEVDTLTKTNAALTLQRDSIKMERDLYFGVYSTIKEKVFKYDFDPTKTSVLIDSLRTKRDSTVLGHTSTSSALRDSLNALRLEYSKYKASVDSVNTGEAKRAKLVTELNQLKTLLDTKVITQAEFDTKKAAVMEKW